MVLLKLTKPIEQEFECEVLDPNLKKANPAIVMVRPCERYKELYKSCKSIRGRLHQYYVYGELFDCNENNERFSACMQFRKTKDVKLLEPVIEWEQNLKKTRLDRAENNPIWQYRESPPTDFVSPLPGFIQKRQSNSTFSTR